MAVDIERANEDAVSKMIETHPELSRVVPAREVIPALEKRTGSLWTLANIATLIGLLGTISGLIRAFKAVGTIDDPSQKTALLSAGIAEAMWNTFLGLLIAVIFMVAHLVLHGLTKRHKHEMEKVTMQLENLLTLRRQGG